MHRRVNMLRSHHAVAARGTHGETMRRAKTGDVHA
jgi:hypothetical protein